MSLRTLGDVVARHPSSISVPENATILELAGALAAGRVDAVAVLFHTTNALAGIATSRDVAKCIARGEDLAAVKVAEVMTAHPVTLPPAETPPYALALMREGGFRHIPVVSEENGAVLGIVDVLNLAYDAITRLQVSYSMIPSRRGFEFMRAARETIEKPTLRPIVERSPIATLTRESSVTQACERLVRQHLAAVVIVDEQGILDGIFTCRDVVNRVVIPKIDPVTTPLAKVMTQNPDCAGPDFTILESLQRMQACGFRHLPVVEDHTRVVMGLVDVLQLASDAITGLQTVAEQAATSHRVVDNPKARSRSGLTGIFTSLFSNTYASRDDISKETQFQQLPPLTPIPAAPQPLRSAVPYNRNLPSTGPRRNYSLLSESSTMSSRTRGLPPDTPLASFKFKDCNGEFRRIKVPITYETGTYDQFVVDVRRRFAGSSSVGPIKIKYIDEDGDEVLLSNDEDLTSCLEDLADSRNKTIQLRVYEVERPSSSQMQSPVSSNASSVIGSPSGTALSVGKPEAQNGSKQQADLPPAIESQSMPGITRATSRPILQTPSMIKIAEAHQKMLDGKHEEAIKLYDEAVELDPDNVRARGGRGAARLINGNSIGAEEDYRAVIGLIEKGKGGSVGDFTFQMCIVGLVEALVDQRRYEEAVTLAGQVDDSVENSGCADAFRDELDSASTAAQEALEAGEFGDAMSCYTNALRVENAYLQLVPSEAPRPSLRLGRAKCYKALEDYDMALEDYEAAVKLDPESVAALKGCGKCLAELEQVDRALESYEKAHKLDPADDEVSREIESLKILTSNSLQGKKAEIAKLGALLGEMNLPGRLT